jgi:hypothetical protein
VSIRRYGDHEIADAYTRFRMAIKGQQVPDTIDYVLASDYDALAAELAECRISRQREHDLRVTLAGELESFKIRYQDEVNARVIAALARSHSEKNA